MSVDYKSSFHKESSPLAEDVGLGPLPKEHKEPKSVWKFPGSRIETGMCVQRVHRLNFFLKLTL